MIDAVSWWGTLGVVIVFFAAYFNQEWSTRIVATWNGFPRYWTFIGLALWVIYWWMDIVYRRYQDLLHRNDELLNRNQELGARIASFEHTPNKKQQILRYKGQSITIFALRNLDNTSPIRDVGWKEQLSAIIQDCTDFVLTIQVPEKRNNPYQVSLDEVWIIGDPLILEIG